MFNCGNRASKSLYACVQVIDSHCAFAMLRRLDVLKSQSIALLWAAGILYALPAGSAETMQKDGSPVPVAVASSAADVRGLAFTRGVSPQRVRFIHTGGNDCPPCVVWRNNELPKLQQMPAFRSINFSYVVKGVRSPFPPSEMFLPDELKPFQSKLEVATGGGRAGSPQQLFLVDGEVYDYSVGDPLNAEDIETRISAILNGTKYPATRCIRRSSERKTGCVEKAASR